MGRKSLLAAGSSIVLGRKGGVGFGVNSGREPRAGHYEKKKNASSLSLYWGKKLRIQSRKREEESIFSFCTEMSLSFLTRVPRR